MLQAHDGEGDEAAGEAEVELTPPELPGVPAPPADVPRPDDHETAVPEAVPAAPAAPAAEVDPIRRDDPDGGLAPGQMSAEEYARAEQEELLRQEREDEIRREVERELDEEGRQRRQNVRVNVQFPVTVRVSGHPGTRVRSRDLSATGVGFATRLPLDINTSGTVTIHFPDWNFSKEMVVRFVKPIVAGRQVGAQFQELTEDERERVVKEVFAVQRAQLQKQRLRQRGIF